MTKDQQAIEAYYRYIQRPGLTRKEFVAASVNILPVMRRHPTHSRQLMQPSREEPKRQVRSAVRGTPFKSETTARNRKERRQRRALAGQRMDPWNR